MHKKGGEVYFKAVRMLCHVAAGQSYWNLPAQGPWGLHCRRGMRSDPGGPLGAGDARLGGCEGYPGPPPRGGDGGAPLEVCGQAQSWGTVLKPAEKTGLCPAGACPAAERGFVSTTPSPLGLSLLFLLVEERCGWKLPCAGEAGGMLLAPSHAAAVGRGSLSPPGLRSFSSGPRAGSGQRGLPGTRRWHPPRAR